MLLAFWRHRNRADLAIGRACAIPNPDEVAAMLRPPFKHITIVLFETLNTGQGVVCGRGRNPTLSQERASHSP